MGYEDLKDEHSIPLDFSPLTGKIIGCAYDVYNSLGFGFIEKIYEECLMIELAEKGLEAQRQVPVSVSYKGIRVGEHFVDILVEDTVIVELKSVMAFNEAHLAQLLNYVSALNRPVGLLLNFGPEKVDVARRSKDWAKETLAKQKKSKESS